MNINKNETLYRLTYASGTFKDVYGSLLDRSLALHREANIEIVSIQQIPFCGWKNPWTDSGDRGAAQADHERTCPVCLPS